MEGALQSAVRIGFMAMDVSNPDFHKFRFLTVLLGGYFGSRLMSNIREENGYTYHIWAEVDAYGKRNAFMIRSETANEYVEPCIKEIYREIARLSAEPIEENEVEHVRNYILGEMCRECEGLTAKSEVFVNAWLSGESFASVNEYLEVVMSVTAAELEEVARRYLDPSRMVEVVVGAV
jgi:predicted Zn-dependent peptidase